MIYFYRGPLWPQFTGGFVWHCGICRFRPCVNLGNEDEGEHDPHCPNCEQGVTEDG